MSTVVLKRIIETCPACPAQWDAWDTTGQYWYLRYRHSRGTAERQECADPIHWADKPPEVAFYTDRGRYDGCIELAEFLSLAGFTLAPDAEVKSCES